MACLAVASFVVYLQPVQSATVLVSQWKLNEGSGGTTLDSAGRKGTLRNGVRWISGRSGAAVNLDGVDDFVQLPALEVTGGALTILAWVRNSSFPAGVSQRFIAKASDSTEQGTYWMVGQTIANQQNFLRFRLRTGTVTTTLTAMSGNLPINTWYHVAATYDGSTMRLYLNGSEVGSIRKSGSLARGIGVPLHVGRSPDGSSYMRGAIDDVRIYSSALTRSEITSVISSAGSPSSPDNQAPTVSLSGPADGASFAAGTTITVSANAADQDGTVSRVAFYDGSTLIGTDTSSPYGVSWSGATIGSHALKAVATDNRGTTKTSATRTVTVRTSMQSPSNQPPSVSLTAPSSGASFIAPASITLSATATDFDGTIARVEFYRGATLIGTDTTRPYSVSWPKVPVGSYSLTAVAKDNAGATTVSSTRDITVRIPGLPTTAVFIPSSNHSTAVEHYVLEVFPAGADIRVANPVATRDLGKPPVSQGEIRVDVASTILALIPGDYVATVTAFGDGGSTQSAASPRFSR
jgi:hypothetical protein